jgi:hypothetical protein
MVCVLRSNGQNSFSMTQQEKRIKIAEKCGWTDIRTPQDASYHDIPTDTLEFLRGMVAGIKPGCIHIENAQPIPDYFSSLDACHEMEKGLSIGLPSIPHTESDKTRYVLKLQAWRSERGAIFATSAERAEAFGITMGLWKEGE